MFAGLFFTVFAYRSGLLNWAQKSGNSWTLGTKQEVIHKHWQGRSASPHHTRPRPWLPRGQWCQAAETALNQRAPFGSSHVEKIRPIFSFQGTELLTQKVTASRSMAMIVYIPIRERKAENKKGQGGFKTACCLMALQITESLREMKGKITQLLGYCWSIYAPVYVSLIHKSLIDWLIDWLKNRHLEENNLLST